MTAYWNGGLAIRRESNKSFSTIFDFASSATASCNPYTEFERVFYPPNYISLRYDSDSKEWLKNVVGTSTYTLVDPTTDSDIQPYYDYLMAYLLSDDILDCPPPYNTFYSSSASDNTERGCYDLSSLTIAVPTALQCQIGIVA